MPFTPFHFGPGLLVKSALPRWFSWTAFCVAQAVIDVEPLYHMHKKENPLHRQLHTLLGAGCAGLVTALGLVALVFTIRQLRAPPTRTWRPIAAAEVSNTGLVVGAMIGALSHPLLDGIMHADVRPFAPWSDDNPLLGLVGLWPLHAACLAAGLVGAVVLLLRVSRERART